jgi:hypothetical protein
VGGRHVVADGQHHRRRPDQGEDGSYDGETLRRDPERSAALAEVVAEIGHEGYRGCAFINAASEFEDPDSPVRRVVGDHRRWFYERVRRAFADAGHEYPANPARHFVMLRDGAVTAAYLDSSTAAQRTFKRGVDGLLRSIDMEILPHGGDGS